MIACEALFTPYSEYLDGHSHEWTIRPVWWDFLEGIRIWYILGHDPHKCGYGAYGSLIKRARFTYRCDMLSYADALRVISPENSRLKIH